jgi:hypothetical protein
MYIFFSDFGSRSKFGNFTAKIMTAAVFCDVILSVLVNMHQHFAGTYFSISFVENTYDNKVAHTSEMLIFVIKIDAQKTSWHCIPGNLILKNKKPQPFV